MAAGGHGAAHRAAATGHFFGVGVDPAGMETSTTWLILMFLPGYCFFPLVAQPSFGPMRVGEAKHWSTPC